MWRRLDSGNIHYSHTGPSCTPWKGANPHGWGGGDQCEDEARDEANKEA